MTAPSSRPHPFSTLQKRWEYAQWRLQALFGDKAPWILGLVKPVSFAFDFATGFMIARGLIPPPQEDIPETLSLWLPGCTAQLATPFSPAARRLCRQMIAYRKRLARSLPDVNPTPTVSVIMPTYNRASCIGRAVESVRRQTYPQWELIVIDDGSTDDTRERLYERDDDRIHVVPHGKRKGAAEARNTGLSRARGNYIAYLDADNEWHPQYLAMMVSALAQSEGWTSAYCAQRLYEESPGGGRRHLRGIRFAHYHRSMLLHNNYIDLNAFIHDIRLYHREGGFDVSLDRFIDWDLIIRYTEHSPPRALPCILVNYYTSRRRKRITTHARYWRNMNRIQTKVQARTIKLGGVPVRIHHHTLSSPPCPVRLTGNPTPVSIIIPSFNAVHCLRLCVEALQAFTPEAFELILVDNASAEPTLEYLRRLNRAHPKIKIERLSHNMGFTHAVNTGLQLCRPDRDVILLNNDAIVTEGWLDGLRKARRIDPGAGVIAPQQVLIPFTKTMLEHVPQALPFNELDVTVSCHHRNVKNLRAERADPLIELNFVTFFCVYITRACLADTGPLDEIRGRHYQSDRLFCKTVEARGRFKIVYTPESKVYHLLQQSTDELRRSNPADYDRVFVRNTWDPEEWALRKTAPRLPPDPIPVYHVASMARSGETLVQKLLSAHSQIRIVHNLESRDAPHQDALFRFLQRYPETHIAMDHPLVVPYRMARHQVLVLKQGVWKHAHPFRGFVLARNPASIYASLLTYDRDELGDDLRANWPANAQRLARWLRDIAPEKVKEIETLPPLEQFITFFNIRMGHLSTLGLPIIRYEQLLEHPARWLQRILDGFHLPFEARMLTAHERYPPGKRGHGNNDLGAPIQTASVYKYQSVLTPSEFMEIAERTRAVCQSLGYTLTWDHIECSPE